MLQPFEKWAIKFVRPIEPRGKTGVRYIITTIKYLTQWAEAQPVKDCTATTTAKFLFKNVLTRYITNRAPYHPQANGTIEAFKKNLETALTKICNARWNDWDLCIPTVLWAYRTTCKKLTSQTPFRLVYGKEAVMPMEYIVPSLWIAATTGMVDRGALEERLIQLDELDEERFLVGFHQQVQKQRDKAWHDHHIKVRMFKKDDLVLLYDSKFEKFPGKLFMHWLGPYVIKEVTDGGTVQLAKLNKDPFPGRVNGSHLKLYMGRPTA
eukprot:PITA_10484